MNVSTPVRLLHLFVISLLAMDWAVTLRASRRRLFDFDFPFILEYFFWAALVMYPVVRVYLKDKHLAWWLVGGLFACRLFHFLVWHGLKFKHFFFSLMEAALWSLIPFIVLTLLWYTRLQARERDEWGG